MQQGKVILARYHSKQVLAQAYLSFTREGGLFVPTSEDFSFNETVFLVVVLPDDLGVFCARGQVTWIGTGRKRGFGVHLHPDESGKRLRSAVEHALGGMLANVTQPLTM